MTVKQFKKFISSFIEKNNECFHENWTLIETPSFFRVATRLHYVSPVQFEGLPRNIMGVEYMVPSDGVTLVFCKTSFK